MFGSLTTAPTRAADGGGEASRTRTRALRDDRLAHDLKNLMAVIVSATETLAASEGAPDDRRALAAASVEAARLSASLLQELLNERGALRAKPPATPAADVLAWTARLAAPLLPRGVALAVTTSASGLRAAVDRDELAAALLNLCKNAGEACEAGGEVTLSATPVAAAAAAEAGLAARPYLRFEVRDTGAGMAPEVLARATEPYFTTKAARGGAGLGLHAVAEFARSVGGGLRLRSEPGRGATVSLYIPRSRAARTSAPGRPQCH